MRPNSKYQKQSQQHQQQQVCQQQRQNPTRLNQMAKVRNNASAASQKNQNMKQSTLSKTNINMSPLRHAHIELLRSQKQQTHLNQQSNQKKSIVSIPSPYKGSLSNAIERHHDFQFDHSSPPKDLGSPFFQPQMAIMEQPHRQNMSPQDRRLQQKLQSQQKQNRSGGPGDFSPNNHQRAFGKRLSQNQNYNILDPLMMQQLPHRQSVPQQYLQQMQEMQQRQMYLHVNQPLPYQMNMLLGPASHSPMPYEGLSPASLAAQKKQLGGHHMSSNLNSEYYSDPDAIQNLIDYQKKLAGPKRNLEEDQYLSFSEASEDNDYYFRRNRNQGHDPRGQFAGNQAQLQSDPYNLVKQNQQMSKLGSNSPSHNVNMNQINLGQSNVSKYEGPLNLINESSQENASVELQQHLQDQSRDLFQTRKSINDQQLQNIKQSVDLGSNDNFTSQPHLQEQQLERTISSIKNIGQKSNSLLISKYDIQNEANLLSPSNRKSQSPNMIYSISRIGRIEAEIQHPASQNLQIGRLSPNPATQTIQPQNEAQNDNKSCPRSIEITLPQKQSNRTSLKKSKEINFQNKEQNLKNQSSQGRGSKQEDESVGNFVNSEKQLDNDFKLKNKVSIRIHKNQQDDMQKNSNKSSKSVSPRRMQRSTAQNQQQASNQHQQKSISPVQNSNQPIKQVSLINKGINLMNSQDSTQLATVNESSFKNNLFDSRLKANLKKDSSRNPNNECGLELNIPRRNDNLTSNGSKRHSNLQVEKLKQDGLSNDNRFKAVPEETSENLHTPQQTKYTEEFPSALGYPKNNFQTPFGAQNNSDISALTQPRLQKQSDRGQKHSMNNAPVFQLYGEVGQVSRDRINSNSNKSSMNYQRNPRNIYMNTISDKKSYKSIQTNTTAMIDDMSFPDERSIDFKLTEFGAKNLRQVVPEQEKILLNKIKNTNSPQNTNRISSNLRLKNSSLNNQLKQKQIQIAPGQKQLFNNDSNKKNQKELIKSQNSRVQRPRIKHTFRGGNAFEHVSYSPERNNLVGHQSIKNQIQTRKGINQNNQQADKQIYGYYSKDVKNTSKAKHLKLNNNELYGIKNKPKNKLMSSKPQQVHASDHSISGISKGCMSQVSVLKRQEQSNQKTIAPMVYPAASPQMNQHEDFQYKTIETLEIDNLYNDNLSPVNLEPSNQLNQKNPIQDQSNDVLNDPNLEQSSNIFNIENKMHLNVPQPNSIISQEGDWMMKSLIQQEQVHAPNKLFSNTLSQSNISNSGVMLKEIESTRLLNMNYIASQNRQLDTRQKNDYSHQSNDQQSNNCSQNNQLQQAQYNDYNEDDNPDNFVHSDEGNAQRPQNQTGVSPESILHKTQINSSLRNNQGASETNKQSIQLESSHADVNHQHDVNINNSRQSISDADKQNELSKQVASQDSQLKSQNQQFQDRLKSANSNQSPMQFEGSSFGGSQVVNTHNHLAQQHLQISAQQKELTQFQSNPQQQVASQKCSYIPGNNQLLENRPYVPKATVILNQDEFEQFELDPIEHSRPFSQTVIEAPTQGVKSQKSRSSLNNSKKSYDHHNFNPTRIESACSEQGLAPLKSNLSGNPIKSQSTLNSLYSRTETPHQNSSVGKKAFLKKGEGQQKRWSSRNDKVSSNQNEDSASKRSDSQKPSYLYFKALKEVNSNNQLKSRKNSNTSDISKSYKSKKEELNQRHQQLIKSKNSEIYYNTKKPKESLSYKQKQINSIERMKKELQNNKAVRSKS